MKSQDWKSVGILWVIAILIYNPVFYTTYAYSDENLQLWLYRPGSSFNMFAAQGRFITDHIFRFLFSRIQFIHELTFLRVFSFAGWMLVIPVWYGIINKIASELQLKTALPFASVLFLICCPAFAISIGWAACMEFFIANTAGLLSGYAVYELLTKKRTFLLQGMLALLGVMFGLISLFTYQNGMGCFFIPFLLLLLANRSSIKIIAAAILFYLAICAIYFLVFKYSIANSGVIVNDRTTMHLDFFVKLRFFIGRALVGAFHFTALANEKSKIGFGASILLMLLLFAFYFSRRGKSVYQKPLEQLGSIAVILAFIYLPSLVVKENYASNRTLLALSVAVFIVCFHAAMHLSSSANWSSNLLNIVALLMTVNAVFNFRFQFLQPAAKEYQAASAAIANNYHAGVDTFYFRRPAEDAVISNSSSILKTRSWDEFGVPSTFFAWVPEYLIRNVVFEKTASWETAAKLTVLSVASNEALPVVSDSAKTVTIDGVLLMAALK